jgi:hypothetical protein
MEMAAKIGFLRGVEGQIQQDRIKEQKIDNLKISSFGGKLINNKLRWRGLTLEANEDKL